MTLNQAKELNCIKNHIHDLPKDESITDSSVKADLRLRVAMMAQALFLMVDKRQLDHDTLSTIFNALQDIGNEQSRLNFKTDRLIGRIGMILDGVIA